MPYSKVNYNFGITMSAILEDGTEIKLDNSLTKLRIKKDFIANIFALYVLDLSLTLDNYKLIMNNNCKISINVYRFNKSNIENDQDITNPNYDKNVLSVILRPYDKTILETSEYTDAVDNDNESANKAARYAYRLVCLDDNSLKINDNVLNDVLVNTDATSAMVNMLSQVFEGTAYIEQADNTNKFTNIIIPPMNFSNAIKFINENYVAYNGYLNTFFDAGTCFMYKIGSNNIATRNIDIKIVKNDLNTNSEIYSSYKADENDNMEIIYKMSPIITSNAEVELNSVGKKRIINSYDENFNMISKEYESNGNSNKERYYWNSTNPIAESKINSALIYNGNLSFINADFSIFVPSTTITISGADTAYSNGKYQILSAAITLTTTDYKTFASSINVTFGKK